MALQQEQSSAGRFDIGTLAQIDTVFSLVVWPRR